MGEKGTPSALTIAGSDPSGGAGIQSDLKTFTALGVYGMAAITAVTVQDTARVAQTLAIPSDLVEKQLEAALADVPVGAVKTGMLANAEIVKAVVGIIDRHRIDRLVVDPVMFATCGAELLDAGGRAALVEELFPRAFIVTPNIPEAAHIADVRTEDRDQVRRAARIIHEMGPRAVLITGGHGAGPNVEDTLFDGQGFVNLESPRVPAAHGIHGTGCAHSAAVTACLALGMELREAVERARAYMDLAISNACSLGHGAAMLNPAGFVELPPESKR